MTDIRTVVVCDDDPQRVRDWAEQIQELLGARSRVIALSPADFARAVAALKQRRASRNISDDAANIIDSAHVLVLDSDLTPDYEVNYPAEESELVHAQLDSELGSEVAHLARAFSTVGAIAVVNEGTQQRAFDLTMRSRVSGVADVYISEDDVASPGLWGSLPADAEAYRPWSWPRLDLLPAVIERAANAVQLDDPWLHHLALDSTEALSRLLVGQLESLGLASAADAETMTFRQLAENGTFGMRRKESTPDALLARVAVCALRRWIERVLLPSQNLIVDLPHLMQTHPWLVTQREVLADWNSIVGCWWGEDAPIVPEAYNRVASSLIGRNVWNVDGLGARPAGARVLPSDPVFCEDTSRFRAIDDVCDYVSDLEGSFARRFVAEIEDVEYMPRNRLAR